MPFEPGDHVLVHSLGKGVVREARRGSRYLVEIKGRSLLVNEAQLSPAEKSKSRERATRLELPASSETPLPRSPVRSLDLHGKTTDEAIVALEIFLNDAILDGVSEVRVIHGRSGGRVRAAVHKALRRLSSIRHYRIDPHNPGVTIVTL